MVICLGQFVGYPYISGREGRAPLLLSLLFYSLGLAALLLGRRRHLMSGESAATPSFHLFIAHHRFLHHDILGGRSGFGVVFCYAFVANFAITFAFTIAFTFIFVFAVDFVLDLVVLVRFCHGSKADQGDAPKESLKEANLHAGPWYSFSTLTRIFMIHFSLLL
jgi:hypothetical protein